MKKLSKKDKIETGIYAGKTVRQCISIYGRESILEILKYYDLEERILEEYHFAKYVRQECPSLNNIEENEHDEDIEVIDSTNVATIESDYEDYNEPYFGCNDYDSIIFIPEYESDMFFDSLIQESEEYENNCENLIINI